MCKNFKPLGWYLAQFWTTRTNFENCEIYSILWPSPGAGRDPASLMVQQLAPSLALPIVPGNFGVLALRSPDRDITGVKITKIAKKWVEKFPIRESQTNF